MNSVLGYLNFFRPNSKFFSFCLIIAFLVFGLFTDNLKNVVSIFLFRFNNGNVLIPTSDITTHSHKNLFQISLRRRLLHCFYFILFDGLINTFVNISRLACLLVCLFVYLFVWLIVYLFIYLFVYLFICLFIYISIYLISYSFCVSFN